MRELSLAWDSPEPVHENMQHAGIILAAGASSRMGRPKSLLETPLGLPLAAAQTQVLEEGGCRLVIVVLGCDYEHILPHLPSCRVVYHPGWNDSRLSSVQAGLRSVDAAGYLILPVDTCGVQPATIRAVLDFADDALASAVRPTWNGKHGRIAWLSRALAEEVLSLDTRKGKTRLDDILETRAVEFAVDDPAILNNVNTPEEWEVARKQMR